MTPRVECLLQERGGPVALHVELTPTQIHTQGSLPRLQAVHRATHPAERESGPPKQAEPEAARRTEAAPGSPAALFEQLDAEGRAELEDGARAELGRS